MIAAAQARENARPARACYLTGPFCDMPAIAAESFDVALRITWMDEPRPDEALAKQHPWLGR